MSVSAMPGPNDPDSAYPHAEPGGGGGGGGGGVPSLNVDLDAGNDNPVLSFTDAGSQNRLFVNVVGQDGGVAETDLFVNAAPATAKLSSTCNGTSITAQALLTAENSNGDTSSSIVARSTESAAFVRVTAANGQTGAAVIVTGVDDGPWVSIFPSGDVESHVPGAGLVLQSPNGTRYRITVANGGTLSASAA